MEEKPLKEKEEIKGYINKIIKSSIVDGPGNRIAIFLQGCNFNCWYCHNPETINRCNDCGVCLKCCEVEAIKQKNDKITYDPLKCMECNICVEKCPRDSSPKILTYTAKELFDYLKNYFDFVDGITFSGGEALLQQDFIREFFKIVKKETDLSCFIDTNGSLEVSQELLEVVDYFMLDVKVVDEEEHQNLTDVSNKQVLKNLKLLNELDKLYEVRTVLYPYYDHAGTIKYVEDNISDKVIYKKIKYSTHGVRTNYLK